MVINNYLYLTAYRFGIFKTDKYLNIIGNYVSDYFEGMYYNSSSNSIFVASYYDKKIVEFTKDLLLLSSFSTANYMPASINGINDKLYVGTLDGVILVLINRIISQVYLGCDSISYYYSATSIFFDNYGNIGVDCDSVYDHYFAVFFINGTFTGNKLMTPVNNSYSSDVKFDSLNRLIAVSEKQISIFDSISTTTTTMSTATTTTRSTTTSTSTTTKTTTTTSTVTTTTTRLTGKIFIY